MTSPARSHAAGLGIQTVPITNCAVMLQELEMQTRMQLIPADWEPAPPAGGAR